MYNVCNNVLARTPRQELTYRAQLPLLEHRHITHLRNFMYKRKCKPEYQLNIQGRTRIHDATLVRTIRSNSRAFKRSVFYRGAKEWNSLDTDTRNIPTIESFKYKQKRWLLSTIAQS